MAKRRHKEVWSWLLDQMTKALAPHDYRPHPVYQPGWEPANQCYECEFLGPFRSDGIRQINFSYAPHHAQIICLGTHFLCADAEALFATKSRTPEQWTDTVLGCPHRQVDIRDGLRGLALIRYSPNVKFGPQGQPVALEKLWSKQLRHLPGFLTELNKKTEDPEFFMPPMDGESSDSRNQG